MSCQVWIVRRLGALPKRVASPLPTAEEEVTDPAAIGRRKIGGKSNADAEYNSNGETETAPFGGSTAEEAAGGGSGGGAMVASSSAVGSTVNKEKRTRRLG